MRHVTSIATLAVLAAGLAACAGEKEKPAPAAPSAPAAAAPAAPAAPAASAAHELKKITPSANYPLKTCVVSGEDLGAMDSRVAYSYDGTEVQFCCPDCIKDFEKEPAKYLAKITAAK
jgi:YHS domain-containing protein